ncbi:alpha/beta fold hydrolase [Pseudoprimorskyibacter insulae]|uniref:Haloacetate dehalogenase H-1 n=1 Tax=Pseudoprimorskyibacter insulae TaxID=1695997 RepID=A0A2R8AXH2_9RHOB|nr:alpha/beta hydrolase [Pseudoprimorskyibacter insulae]SPF80723.1 Haloacetate dehalogenase H-1 [Pseudoprimorskyibacter insulae]
MTDAASLTFANGDQTVAYDVSGNGPPVLLLHGFPQTRAMWRPIAAQLRTRFTVITADLRGYGDSSAPPRMEDMSFRAMSDDMIALMAHLGHDRFHLVGHDRGARTAHRMALDHAGAIQTLTVMDIVPTHLLLDQMTTPIARAYYHWFFLAQPAPLPETMIGHDPDAYFERCLLGFGKAELSDFDPVLLDDYRRAWRDPRKIAAMCNDYRAAIDVDFALDAADLNRRVTCPSLVLFGKDGAVARTLDVGATWLDRLTEMQAKPIPGGHFFPDQYPDETAQALLDFLPG